MVAVAAGYSVDLAIVVVVHKALLACHVAYQPIQEVVVVDAEAVVAAGVEVVGVANWDFVQAFGQVQEVFGGPEGRPVVDQVASFVVALGLDYVKVPSMDHRYRRAVNRWWVVLRDVHVAPVHCGTLKQEIRQTLIDPDLVFDSSLGLGLGEYPGF